MFTEILYHLSNLSISVLIILPNTNTGKIKDAIFVRKWQTDQKAFLSIQSTSLLFDEGYQLLYKEQLLHFMIDFVLFFF